MQILNRYNNSIIFKHEKGSLVYTTLSNTNLNSANLRGADLRGTNLNSAILSYADLSYANLSDAYLVGTDLSYANLYNTDLRGTNLRGTDLSYAKYIKSFQCGEYNRVSYAIKWESEIMFKIGCFWGNTEEAILKVKEKYGDNSDYEKLIKLYTEILKEEK